MLWSKYSYNNRWTPHLIATLWETRRAVLYRIMPNIQHECINEDFRFALMMNLLDMNLTLILRDFTPMGSGWIYGSQTAKEPDFSFCFMRYSSSYMRFCCFQTFSAKNLSFCSDITKSLSRCCWWVRPTILSNGRFNCVMPGATAFRQDSPVTNVLLWVRDNLSIAVQDACGGFDLVTTPICRSTSSHRHRMIFGYWWLIPIVTTGFTDEQAVSSQLRASRQSCHVDSDKPTSTTKLSLVLDTGGAQD